MARKPKKAKRRVSAKRKKKRLSEKRRATSKLRAKASSPLFSRTSRDVLRQKTRKAKTVSPKRLQTRKQSKGTAPDIFEDVHRTKIRVVGIGGGGGNIVAEIASRVQKFDFIGANTDTQALQGLPRKVKSFAFGKEFTHGLGCGMEPQLGEQAARAEKEKIKKFLEDQDICIVIACLGGGTGSGAAPVFAEISQDLRNITFGIFTMPFSFEGEKRKQLAEQALQKLQPFVNAYVVIPNDKIFGVVDKKTPLKEAFSQVNKRLADTLEGFMTTLSSPGLINIDFADVRSVLEGRGRLAYINSAISAGPGRGQEAVRSVLAHPLYDYGIEGADRLFFNIMGDRSLKMQEVAAMSKTISDYNPRAKTVFGISLHPTLRDRVRITLFAVGCARGGQKELKREKKPALPQVSSVEVKDQDVPAKIQEGTRAQAKPSRPAQRKSEVRYRMVPGKAKLPGKARANKKEIPLKARKNQRAKSLSAPPLPPRAVAVSSLPRPSRLRRNALDVKKAIEEEIQELEKKEKAWDFPAFLKNKSS